MVHKNKNTENFEISLKTDFLCDFLKITTDFENRLKHQFNIILWAFLDSDLLVHILLSNVSPFGNRKFPSISHTFGFGATF